MKRQEITITIDTDGAFTLEAGEGIAGQSCREVTKNIELALGGVSVDTENKSSFYDDEDGMDLDLKL